MWVGHEERSRPALSLVLVEHVGVPRQRPTVADRLVGAVRRPHRMLDEMPGEHMPCAPVAPIVEVLEASTADYVPRSRRAAP